MLVDASEANVKVFGADGDLVRVVGRRGAGPGEFRFPNQARWLPDGQLAVFDFGNQRVHFFLPSFQVDTSIGEFGTETLQDLVFLRGDTMYFSAGIGGSALYGVLPKRGIVDSLFSHPLPPVSSHPGNPAWGAIAKWRAASSGDTVFLMSSVSDTLWTLDWKTHKTSARRLELPDYRRPGELPSGPSLTPQTLQTWASQYDFIGGFEVLDGALLVWYANAPIFTEPEASLVLVDRSGNSRVYRAPFYPMGRDQATGGVFVKTPATSSSAGDFVLLRALR